jgi:hypothetical protein
MNPFVCWHDDSVPQGDDIAAGVTVPDGGGIGYVATVRAGWGV